MAKFHGATTRPTRQYYVEDQQGGEHHVTAHFAFDNAGEGLIFRRHIDDNPNNRTYVVAAFAQGAWRFYKETDHG